MDSSFPPQKLHSQEWQSAVATIPASQLVDFMKSYGDNLTSANVRDYLGSRKTARNINRQISKTAQEEPQNFWIYNNGITVLTNAIDVEGNQLKLTGMAIINGAQTAGSLVESSDLGSLDEVEIAVRAIKCNNSDLVDSVIRYNNTQNPIKAWELRVMVGLHPTVVRLEARLFRTKSQVFGPIGLRFSADSGQCGQKAGLLFGSTV